MASSLYILRIVSKHKYTTFTECRHTANYIRQYIKLSGCKEMKAKKFFGGVGIN